MQNETSSAAFLQYGSVYKTSIADTRTDLICRTQTIQAEQQLSQFLYFSCDTYIEVQSGIGILLVSPSADASQVVEFSMNKRIHVKPNIYYAISATTPEMVINLYNEPDFSLDITTLPSPYELRSVLPLMQIKRILGYFYRIRSSGYHFQGETHDFFELTYVDSGTLYTEVDGVKHTIHEREMIIYGPNQFHTQYTAENETASYVTILFEMENLSSKAPANWYDILINTVFPYDRKFYMLIKAFVRESTSDAPYMDSLMLCLLSEIIIRLLQGVYAQPSTQPASVMRQNYQDELFERINSYIESKLYEPLTVADICQQFSLSRSSLQLLFKNAVNQSPKKYISDMKLEKSCQMLRENKYTVSEISLKLGYSSIHYFSNAFSQKYKVSPSEYAKRIY